MQQVQNYFYCKKKTGRNFGRYVENQFESNKVVVGTQWVAHLQTKHIFGSIIYLILEGFIQGKKLLPSETGDPDMWGQEHT